MALEETLGSSLELGPRRARNRIFFGPHETNLGRRRSISERHVAYYRARGQGGVGVVVVEEASVHPSDFPYERCPLASDCADGWAAVATALHETGALALAAIGHSGLQGTSAYSQAPLWAPSPVPEVPGREVPKAMEPEDIAEVVAGFAEATGLALSAGLDGVELNAGQNSLVRQFLSGLTNRREDEYGQDRLRFAREVLSGVRDAAGDGVVGLRLSCDELFPYGGIEPAEGAAIAVELAELAHYIVVVRGSIYSVADTHPDGHEAPLFNSELAERVRKQVWGRVPIVLQGSVVDVEPAAAAAEAGACDAVEMTRAQIAEPELALKALGGDLERVRPCTLCNQNCRVRDPRNPIVSCMGEPFSGHETEDAPVGGSAHWPLDVLVVGGGPAGLECARVAALRGHRVRLRERLGRLGGALRAAAAGPGRERLGLLADWLERECRRLGVEIELEQEVGAEELGGPGTVVLATGSVPAQVPFEVDADARLVTALDVLAAELNGGAAEPLPEGPVAVWDPVGGPVAVAVAELLARARPVTFVTQDIVVGQQLARTGDMGGANGRLHQAGVQICKRAKLRRVAAGSAHLEDVFSDHEWDVEAAAVVDCGHRLPDEALWEATGRRFQRAGDAIAPRTVYEAVLEGRRAAWALEGAT